MISPKDRLNLLFAHSAYQLGPRFAARETGMGFAHAWTREDFLARLPEAEVVVASGFWENGFLDLAPKLRFIQSVSAGVDRFDAGLLKAKGVRLASAQGANARAVSDHAMALILALARRLPEARDNQAKHHFRGLISEIAAREEELAGKTLLIVGLGGIGGRLARLAKAFEMTVIGVRQNPSAGLNGADEVHGLDALPALLPRADIVVLTCPLTPATRGLIDAAALKRMKRSAQLVNCARGPCVDEEALIAALADGTISAAALDVFAEEPLAAASPLWDMPNVLITPHSAGETQRYEENVLDILMDNLDRLWRGETKLRNEIV